MRPLAIAAILAVATPAAAECPDRAASCMLHEEGVALLVAGKYGEAVGKFKASIAAGATARAYLGYAQALEGDGKIAQAYEAMVVAAQMSADEIAKTPNDVDVKARAERIKYKQAELQTKVGFAWLRLPDGVPPQRLVSVQRKDESDIPSPLTHLVPVAPRQELTAHMSDGTRIHFIADVAPGSTAAVVIPVRGQRVAPGGVQPGGVQPGGVQPGGVQPGGTQPGIGGPVPPAGGVYQPLPPPPEPPLTQTSIGLAVGFIVPGIEDMSEGYSILGYYEQAVSAGLMLSVHGGYIHHPTKPGVTGDITGGEIFGVAGLRTRRRGALYGLAAAGFTVLARTDSSRMTDSTYGYPAFELGGGLRWGSFRVQASLDYAINVSDGGDIPLRFMMTAGYDLYRK
jgi:hypothetical protein